MRLIKTVLTLGLLLPATLAFAAPSKKAAEVSADKMELRLSGLSSPIAIQNWAWDIGEEGVGEDFSVTSLNGPMSPKLAELAHSQAKLESAQLMVVSKGHPTVTITLTRPIVTYYQVSGNSQTGAEETLDAYGIFAEKVDYSYGDTTVSLRDLKRRKR